MSWESMLQSAKSFYGYLRKRILRGDGSDLAVDMDPINQFHREQIFILDHLINVKIADLIYRMEEKSTGVPLNERKNTPQRNESVIIYGKDLVSWFIANMGIAPNEALYLAYLMSSHSILYAFTNHYFVRFNFGFFHRYPAPQSRNSSLSAQQSDAILDHEYVSYLCLKSMRLSMRGKLDGYEIDDAAKLYVDITKWKFEFIQAEPLNL